MVQINLIGKKKRKGVLKNKVLVSMVLVFGGFVIYFLGTTAYVMISLSTVNREIKKVDDQAVVISGQISSNKEALTKYVLTKYILDKVESLKKERFRYKDYLDQIAGFIPPSGVLTTVDFATKGWIDVSVSLPGVGSLKELESRLSLTGGLAQSEFATVFAEQVSRDKVGLYNAKLHFEIKKDGRN